MKERQNGQAAGLLLGMAAGAALGAVGMMAAAQDQRRIPGSDVAAQPAALVKVVGKGLPAGKHIFQRFFLCSKGFLPFCQQIPDQKYPSFRLCHSARLLYIRVMICLGQISAQRPQWRQRLGSMTTGFPVMSMHFCGQTE